MATDPIVEQLDRAAHAPTVSPEIARVLRRVKQKLDSGQGTMAWETVPLALFGDALPPTIASCWVFVIRPGADTGAERHPNSHQRSLSLVGRGEFQLRPVQKWEPHPLVSGRDEPLERRWVSIPVSTWHRVLVGPEAWGMLSFHTVPAAELIEERPVDPAGLDGGPTEQHRYADLT